MALIHLYDKLFERLIVIRWFAMAPKRGAISENYKSTLSLILSGDTLLRHSVAVFLFKVTKIL